MTAEARSPGPAAFRPGGRQRRYTRNEITVVQYAVQLADEGG